jgi:hypothetical protein
MSRRLFVRVASGLGVLSLAVLFVGLVPFLSAQPGAGAGLFHRSPPFSVNRAFKGDRLPIAPISAASSATSRRQHPEDIPVGCDASFSPISTPRLAYIYGRCTT